MASHAETAERALANGDVDKDAKPDATNADEVNPGDQNADHDQDKAERKGDESEGTEAKSESEQQEQKEQEPPKGGEETNTEERKLFVGGLSWETQEADLQTYFEQFGSVEAVNLKLHPLTGKSRCFAFIVFDAADSVDRCLGQSEHVISSKKVDVKKAKAKPGKIFVGGLKPEMSDEQIREVFERHGKIIEFEMPYDKVRRQRKGFGFITFEREETMKELLKQSKIAIGQHMVDLRKATPRQDVNSHHWAAMGQYRGYNSYMGGGGGGGGYFGGGGHYGHTGGYGNYSYNDFYGASGGQWGGGGYGNYGHNSMGGGGAANKMRPQSTVGRGVYAKRDDDTL